MAHETSIIPYHTVTTSTVPAGSSLAKGEIALNVTDKQIFSSTDGTDVVTLYDPAALAPTDDLIFSNDNPNILGGDTNGILLVSANTASLGANIRLHGDTETDGGDFKLYDDTTLELHFDASASTFDLQANAMTTTGALNVGGTVTVGAAAQHLYLHAIDTQYTSFSGGNAYDSGSTMRLYGGTHATAAGNIQFLDAGATELEYDKSDSDWDFQANAITTTGTLNCGALTSTGIDDNCTAQRMQLIDTLIQIGDPDTGGANFTLSHQRDDCILRFAGGNVAGAGGEVVAYGGTHGSKPDELELRTGNTVALTIDSSQDATFAGAVITASAGELTIATGAVTATGSFHTIDTEADAASDDLDTINGGSAGQRLVVTANTTTRTVVMKDGTGNLQLAGDFSMDNTQDTMELIYNGTNWLELSRSNNGA